MRTEDAAETKGSRMTWAHIQWPEPPVKSWRQLQGKIITILRYRLSVIVEATKTHLRRQMQSNKTWLRSTAFHLCVGIFFCNLRCSIYHLAFYFTYTSLHLAFTYNNTHVKNTSFEYFSSNRCRILQPPFPWSCQLIDTWPGFGEPMDTVSHGHWLLLELGWWYWDGCFQK